MHLHLGAYACGWKCGISADSETQPWWCNKQNGSSTLSDSQTPRNVCSSTT